MALFELMFLNLLSQSTLKLRRREKSQAAFDWGREATEMGWEAKNSNPFLKCERNLFLRPSDFQEVISGLNVSSKRLEVDSKRAPNSVGNVNKSMFST